jgi:hypothetical protein
MANTPALISLKTVVSSFINRSTIDVKFLEKYMAIAVECISELSIFHTHTMREAHLPISSVNMCNLPPDYISWARPPAFIIGNRICELTEDRNIPLDSAIDCGNQTNPQPIGTAGDHFPLYRGNGGGTYGSHGLRGIAFYRIDDEARVIRLRGSITTDTLYLEYLSTGISLDGETLIPRQLLPVIREYLNWQSKKYDPKASANSIQMAKEDYEQQLDLLQHWNNSFSIKEFLDTVRRNYSQSVKG